MTSREILLAAADHIEAVGHCRKAFQDPSGACCAVGAINRVANGWSFIPNVYKAQSEAFQVLAKILPNPSNDKDAANTVTTWNDDPDLCADGAACVAKLREAAATLEL